MPDEVALDLSRQWVQKAAEDLEAARQLQGLPTTRAFHCQQAVAKGKALLVLCDVDFTKTHDIDVLLRQLDSMGLNPEGVETSDLAALTRFAVDTRYPPESASDDAAGEALSIAEDFHRWTEATIASHGA